MTIDISKYASPEPTKFTQTAEYSALGHCHPFNGMAEMVRLKVFLLEELFAGGVYSILFDIEA